MRMGLALCWGVDRRCAEGMVGDRWEGESCKPRPRRPSGEAGGQGHVDLRMRQTQGFCLALYPFCKGSSLLGCAACYAPSVFLHSIHFPEFCTTHVISRQLSFWREPGVGPARVGVSDLQRQKLRVGTNHCFSPTHANSCKHRTNEDLHLPDLLPIALARLLELLRLWDRKHDGQL